MSGLGTIEIPDFLLSPVEAASPSEVGELTRWPIGYEWDYEKDPHDLFEIFYRVKTWRLHVQLAGFIEHIDPGSGEEGLPFNFERTIEVPHGNVADDPYGDEREMIDLPYGPVTYQQDFFSGIGTERITWDIVGNSTTGDFTKLKKHEDLYYPRMRIVHQCDIFGSGFVVNYTELPAGLVVSEASKFRQDHTFLGKNFRAERACDSFHQVIFFLNAMEVEAAEYWPYDPGDGGGPIWDATTGSQIRNRWDVQQWS